MSVLSDATIRKFCKSHQLIEPFEEWLLQPASYDLRLYDLKSPNPWIEPGEFLLASTVETINMFSFLVGRLEGKSSWARKGLIIHTAGFIDPGFKGQVTLEITNLSKNRIPIDANIPICQIAFYYLDQKAENPYGSAKLNSHYQGQFGATPSWIE